MNLHQFKMNELEFSGYLLGLRKGLMLEPDAEIMSGDNVILTETDNATEKETGRNIVFKIQEVVHGKTKVGEKFYDYILLKRLKNYDEEVENWFKSNNICR